MSVYEALLLNTAVPQIQAAQAGDSYVMVVNASTDALRITQTGSGNALVVEDSTNPDATPFVVDASGNVGIGTSSPGTKLDVSGNEYVSGYIRAGTSSNLVLQNNGAGYNLAIAETAANTYCLGWNGSTGGAVTAVLTWNQAGNLGLGVTPSGWGSGNRALELGGGGIDAPTASGYAVETFSNCYYNGTNWIYKSNGYANRFVNYGTQANTTGAFAWFTAGTGTAGNAITFTQAMTLDASGNLGIGTTSPALPLHVYNASAALAYFESTSANGPYVIWRSSGTSIGDVGSGKGISGAGNATDFMIASRSTYPLIFGTNSTERMRLDSSGNLGLAATSVNTLVWGANYPKLVIGTGVSTGVMLFQSTAAAANDKFMGGISALNLGSGVTGNESANVLFYQDGTSATNPGSRISFWTRTDGGSLAERARISSDGTFRVKGAGTAGSTDAVQFSGSAPAASMVLTSAGNLGVGTASASLGVAPYAYVVDIRGTTSDQNFGGSIRLASNDNTTTDSQIWLSTSGLHIQNTKATDIIFYTSSTAKARITSGGAFLVGTSDTGSNSGIGLKDVYDAAAPYYATVGSSTANNKYSYLLYSTGASAFRFYVGYDGTVSATNTTISAISDQRLKENVRDLDVGLDKIMALKPRKFDWKPGKGMDKKDARGFIAQEFQEVFPDLVDQWADPAPEGEDPYLSVRQDLIPVLVKAIQEQQAMINELKAEVAALKGN